MKTFYAVLFAVALFGVGVVASAADTTSLAVSGTVVGTCKFTGTSGISFTLDPDSSAAAAATGSVTYWCTRGQVGTLTVGSGQHGSSPIYNLQSSGTPADQVRYSLSPLTDSYTGQGKSTPKTLTITGSVANIDYINAAAHSDYTDSVTVTISP
jgi:spore coat protein U-like protein